MRRSALPRVIALGLVLAVAASGCSAPILANAPIVFPAPPGPSAGPERQHDPTPIVLPRDDGPHHRLTEWWYYTGHLFTDAGRRFGFEAVVFRAERGSVPPSWAAHLALTDEQGHDFHYAQRGEIGPQADHSPRDSDGRPTGFDLNLGGVNPTLVAAGASAVAPPWRLSGSDGTDHVEAALTAEEAAAAGASFGLELDLASEKPPARHNGNGFVDFGPAGSSYYYSRTRMTATGALDLDGQRMAVEGIAWFDHQWGDFVSVGGGGWDWFAVNLDDGTDLTISNVLDADGNVVLRYGTLVDPAGAATHLGDDDLTVSSLDTWTSPATGATYPEGWRVTVASEGLALTLGPTLRDQELDTRATTGVAYWEGSQEVSGFRRGARVDGEAYVEITRYRP